LAYAKDLQDDKALTFEAFDAFDLCTAAMAGMMQTSAFDRAALRAAAEKGYSTATELADWLVRELGMPFRDAHHVTGACVKRAEALGIAVLSAMPLAEFQGIEPRITQGAVAILDVDKAVEARDSFGGTAPARVREAIGRWRAQLGQDDQQEEQQ
jgi:argininosuccinate lyase